MRVFKTEIGIHIDMRVKEESMGTLTMGEAEEVREVERQSLSP